MLFSKLVLLEQAKEEVTMNRRDQFQSQDPYEKIGLDQTLSPRITVSHEDL